MRNPPGASESVFRVECYVAELFRPRDADPGRPRGGPAAIFWPSLANPRQVGLNPAVPLSQKLNLKPGIDIVGGSSMLYEIKAPEGTEGRVGHPRRGRDLRPSSSGSTPNGV
jgi:hypothetical protein